VRRLDAGSVIDAMRAHDGQPRKLTSLLVERFRHGNQKLIAHDANAIIISRLHCKLKYSLRSLVARTAKKYEHLR
jgi:hypothetical protein